MKRKGFTLVELLGVIILLGVLAVVIAPNIIKIQEKSEKDVFKESVNSLLRSAQMYYANNNFINYPADGIPANSTDLEVNNNKNFTSGTVKLMSKEYFYAENISNGKFCATGVRNDLSVSIGACPATPARCFDFDRTTGTITKFRSGKVGCAIKNPTVPEEIDGVKVKAIGFAAFIAQDLKPQCSDPMTNEPLNIPNPGIDDSCIVDINLIVPEKHFQIISVNLPSSIEYIYPSAFAYQKLTAINFPNMTNLKQIGFDAFGGNALNAIDFSSNKKLEKINIYALFGAGITSVIFEGAVSLREIGGMSFAQNTIKEVNLVNLPNLEIIGTKIPFATNELADGTMTASPFGMNSSNKGKLRLENLPKIKEVGNLEYTMTDFADVTIKNMPNFEQIKIGSFAPLYGESVLNKLTLENNPKLTKIGNLAFMSNLLTNLSLPSTITSIGELAFAGGKIASINYNGAKITDLGGGAFNGNKLPDANAIFYKKNIDGTEDTSTIISYGGAKLAGVTLPNNITTISKNGFYNCRLTSITLPSNLNAIGDEAFLNNELTNISLPTSVKTIGKRVFQNNKLTALDLSNVTSLGEGVLNSNKFPDATAFIYAKNPNGSNDNTKLISYAGAKLAGVTVPTGVTELCPGSFGGTFITSISLPSTLTTIRTRAFHNNNQLNNPTIPSSITVIEPDAFTGLYDTNIYVKKPANSIPGSPWGANRCVIRWG
ncbi:MAG: leucine-rich repeat protein [Bacilli bacterium]